MTYDVNDKRGEFILEIDGEPQKLRYSMAGTRELMDAFKAKSISDLFSGADKWGPEQVVTLVRIGLKRGSMPEVTDEELSEMLTLDQVGYYLKTISGRMSPQRDSALRFEVTASSPEELAHMLRAKLAELPEVDDAEEDPTSPAAA